MRFFLRSLLAAVSALGSIAFAAQIAIAEQQSPSAPKSAANSSTMPALIGMCEDSDGCSDWAFSGNQGNGLWADGANADLTITHLDATSITIHRVDSKGTGAGIVADYTGTIANNWIEGDVSATWAGHQQGTTHTKWHALIFPSLAVMQNTGKNYQASLPQATGWTVCHDTGDKCSAANPPIDTLLVLAGQSAAMRMLPDASAQIFLYVEEFPDGTLQIRRFDKTGLLQGATTLYKGKREAGKISGTLETIWPGHANAPTAGKFVALSRQNRCQTTDSAQTAEWTGMLDDLMQAKPDSLNCYQIAANRGDKASAATVGLAYYKNATTAADYKNALPLLQKAADQGNTDAFSALAVMYHNGLGTPADLLLAHYYADRVEIRKEGLDQPGYALSASGDSIAYLLVDMKDSDVALSLDHEKAIIRSMRQGASRVAAEEKYYNELESHHATYENNAGPVCSPPDPRYYAVDSNGHRIDSNGHRIDPSGKTYAQAQRDYQTCQSDWEGRQGDMQGKLDGYLRCVRKYADSNAIEDNCPHFQ